MQIVHRTSSSFQKHKSLCVKNGRWDATKTEIEAEDAEDLEREATVSEQVASTRQALGL